MALKSDASYNSLETFYIIMKKNISIWSGAFFFWQKVEGRKKQKFE